MATPIRPNRIRLLSHGAFYSFLLILGLDLIFDQSSPNGFRDATPKVMSDLQSLFPFRCGQADVLDLSARSWWADSFHVALRVIMCLLLLYHNKEGTYMNKILIGGYLGSDPVTRQVGGHEVCSFILGVRAGKEGIFWVSCSAWDAVSIDIVPLKKGAQICVKGHLKEERWTDKSTGAERSKLSVVASEVFVEPSATTGELPWN
jgi:hypothetical protein